MHGIHGVGNYQYLLQLRQSQGPKSDANSAALRAANQGQPQNTKQTTQGRPPAFLRSLFRDDGENNSTSAARTTGSSTSQRTTVDEDPHDPSFTTKKKNEGCFIATAAYGSYLDPHVEALRVFRDRYLMTSGAGRYFVGRYYRYSPALAAVIARHETLRSVTRWALTPLVLGVVHPFLFGLVLLGTAGLAAGRRRVARIAMPSFWRRPKENSS